MMAIPSGLELVTAQAEKEAILRVPEIARRLVGIVVNVNDPQTYFLREADGPFVIQKKGRWDYDFIAPSLDEASPHVQRGLDWVFNETDGGAAWFDSENGFGAELGADSSGSLSRLTLDNGRIVPKMFHRWRLSLNARIEHHEAYRIEGGRVRRALVKSGALLGNVRDQNKDAHDRRLGFLSHAAAGGQLLKGIVAYDEVAVRGLRTVQVLASTPVPEFELFDARVKIIDGKLEVAAGRA